MPHSSFVEARSCLGCELHWGAVLQAAVRTLLVVVLLPLRDLFPRIGQIAEPVFVQALIAKTPVETLHVTILHRSSGLTLWPMQGATAMSLIAKMAQHRAIDPLSLRLRSKQLRPLSDRATYPAVLMTGVHVIAPNSVPKKHVMWREPTICVTAPPAPVVRSRATIPN